jgi:nucleotidyltransferase/DNA polymerase involved in DNA repair
VLRALQAVIPERYPVRVGISSGKFTAWVAANRAAAQRPVVVPHQAKREFLQDAPATLLPVDALLARQLHLLGLRTLDRISQLPRSALLARFGRPGEWIHRLASGDDREPLVPYCPDPVLRETLAFPDTAPTQAHFLLALGRLLRRIWMRPERGGRAVRQVRLEAGLELGGSWERLVTLRKPCERWEAAFAELKRRLEGLLPSAALTELSVELTALATRIDAQGVLFQSEAQHRMERLRLEVEQLVERQRIDGPAPVLRIVEVDPWSFLPEERYGLIRYDF